MLTETEQKAISLFEELSEEKQKRILRYAEATAYENILQFIQKNPGIQQKEIYRLFPYIPSGTIRRKLVSWEQKGKIIRTKSGDTYSVKIK